MYNQKVQVLSIEGDLKLVEVRQTNGGTEVLLKGKSVPANMRKARMFTLSQFRELFVPDGGLWTHYFRCLKCDWERKNPKLAVCIYCDEPMTEVNCPAHFKREENGVDVLQLRPDLAREIDEELEARQVEQNRNLIRKDGDIKIIRIDV